MEVEWMKKIQKRVGETSYYEGLKRVTVNRQDQEDGSHSEF